MKNQDAIVTPLPGKHPPFIGDLCVMIGNPADMDCFRRMARMSNRDSRGLLMSRLYWRHQENFRFSVIGPFVGAPYAVILQEIAISWGVKEIIFFGWCGAVSKDVHAGDVIIPSSALIDDGTSKNYLREGINEVFPSGAFQQRIKNGLEKKKIGFHEGKVWSTDAIYRETHEKISFYQGRQVLGVEMEAAALFSVGVFRAVDVGCILVVSDEVSGGGWVRGYSAPGFIRTRQAVCGMLHDLIQRRS